jgi:hypothetical protein
MQNSNPSSLDNSTTELQQPIETTSAPITPKPMLAAGLNWVIVENEELGEKIVALNKAISSDGFVVKVGLFQFELLHLQHSAMLTYQRVLIMRINDLKNAQAFQKA